MGRALRRPQWIIGRVRDVQTLSTTDNTYFSRALLTAAIRGRPRPNPNMTCVSRSTCKHPAVLGVNFIPPPEVVGEVSVVLKDELAPFSSDALPTLLHRQPQRCVKRREGLIHSNNAMRLGPSSRDKRHTTHAHVNATVLRRSFKAAWRTS